MNRILGKRKGAERFSDSSAKARFCLALCEVYRGNLVKVDIKPELFSYAIDEAALRQAELMGGKLLMVTNVQDMTTDKVIERYKSLADIERGLKVLKSELEIGPAYPRLPERIRAHASICFMALILHRVMRMRFRAANIVVTPGRVLQSLKRIQHHRVSTKGAPPLSGVSCMTTKHKEVPKALKVKTPGHSQQFLKQVTHPEKLIARIEQAQQESPGKLPSVRTPGLARQAGQASIARVLLIP